MTLRCDRCGKFCRYESADISPVYQHLDRVCDRVTCQKCVAGIAFLEHKKAEIAKAKEARR